MKTSPRRQDGASRTTHPVNDPLSPQEKEREKQKKIMHCSDTTPTPYTHTLQLQLLRNQEPIMPSSWTSSRGVVLKIARCFTQTRGSYVKPRDRAPKTDEGTYLFFLSLFGYARNAQRHDPFPFLVHPFRYNDRPDNNTEFGLRAAFPGTGSIKEGRHLYIQGAISCIS